jgi:hypothetical protein
MIGKLLLGASLVISLCVSAQAAMTVAPPPADAGVVRVAEGCGPGFWRGPGGACHPFAVGRACPVGYHLGPEGGRCWPNAAGFARACPPGFHLGPQGGRCWPN